MLQRATGTGSGSGIGSVVRGAGHSLGNRDWGGASVGDKRRRSAAVTLTRDSDIKMAAGRGAEEGSEEGGRYRRCINPVSLSPVSLRCVVQRVSLAGAHGTP